jgi:hypothetical protein
MTIQDTIHTRPAWLTDDLRERDLSDVWQEETDPNAELGEACTAFYQANDAGQLTLVGIRVEDLHGATYHDREHAIGYLGSHTVHRVETVEEQWMEDGL